MMRLDKLLAHMNYGSRKEVKEWIRKGYVSVNGSIIKNDDFKVAEETDEIVFLNETIHYESKIYLVMNKPKGVVSATFDSKEKTILDLIEGYDQRGLFPVGRLDKDTTGLLVITNDGQLAHQLLSPAKHVQKCYAVTFTGKKKLSMVDEFQKGIVLEDGYPCLPAKLEFVADDKALITIMEGKFHQVKRMFASVGLEVIELKRISFGGLVLPKDLELGKYRKLTEEELYLLKQNEG